MRVREPETKTGEFERQINMETRLTREPREKTKTCRIRKGAD